MYEVEKNEANYVLVISNAYTKRLMYKFYFDLESAENVEDMVKYVLDKYPGAIRVDSRIEFARVVGGNTLRKEF